MKYKIGEAELSLQLAKDFGPNEKGEKAYELNFSKNNIQIDGVYVHESLKNSIEAVLSVEDTADRIQRLLDLFIDNGETLARMAWRIAQEAKLPQEKIEKFQKNYADHVAKNKQIGLKATTVCESSSAHSIFATKNHSTLTPTAAPKSIAEEIKRETRPSLEEVERQDRPSLSN